MIKANLIMRKNAPLSHFWIIWNPTSTYAPTTQFKNATVAQLIAVKLAILHPTDKFYVLEVNYHSVTETVNGQLVTTMYKKGSPSE